jgi:hypothetical protein
MKYWALTIVAISLTTIADTRLASAGTVQDEAGGGVTWQAGVDGVEIEWNPDGSLRRLSSKFSTPVEFNDRRGISKAQIIAEEKAKAAIIRFIEQASSSTRVIAEVDNDLSKATQERETGKATSVRKVNERTLIENLTEVTASYSSGELHGVIVLEKGYDDKAEEAWVVVGISDKTIKAARAVKSMGQGQDQQRPSSGSEVDVLGHQPGEVRRSNQKDW